MKRTLSVILAVSMLLCCAAAFAENGIVPAYKLITVIPEGYETSGEHWVDPFIVVMSLNPTAEGKPSVLLVVSYNDAFSDMTFNSDMPEADFKAQIDQLTYNEETGEQMKYTVQETGLGTRVVLINDPEGYTEFYSVWHGYEVSLHCANLNEQNEPKPLTDDQIAEIMQFLTDMDFQKVIEEVEEPAA